jgi:hypothetical protein
VDRLLYAAKGTIHEITRTNTKRTKTVDETSDSSFDTPSSRPEKSRIFRLRVASATPLPFSAFHPALKGAKVIRRYAARKLSGCLQQGGEMRTMTL